ncbi:hypothetical protein NKH18_01175 [Streptomyces sp. M10(2022)]
MTQDHCEAFIKEYGVIRDASGAMIRSKAGNSLRSVVSAMQEMSDYADVLSADRYRAGSGPGANARPGRSPGVQPGRTSRSRRCRCPTRSSRRC